jgi:hypothetical protein
VRPIGAWFFVIAPGTGNDTFAKVRTGSFHYHGFMEFVVMVDSYRSHHLDPMANLALGGHFSRFGTVGRFCKERLAKGMGRHFHNARFHRATFRADQFQCTRMRAIGRFQYPSRGVSVRQQISRCCIAVLTLGAGKSLLVHNEIDTLEEAYKKVQAVTAEQITEVAEEIFSKTSTLIYQ